MDCSLPGSSVHGISQARILEWVAISEEGGSEAPHLPPWKKRRIRMGGGVGTVERDGPFLFRILLSLSIFSNKNVSIHVFFLKTKMIKRIKENEYIKL